MKSDEKNLFQIGEVTKALGITRRILINYEDLGLVTPAVKNEGQGFRYYSADNMVHIKLIRALQNLGLSLAEIRSYFNNTVELGTQIDRLVLLRNELDQYIAQLRLRQSRDGEEEIRKVTLPAFTAFCREFHDAGLVRRTSELRETYIEAVKNYKLNTEGKMCIQHKLTTDRSGRYIVPVSPDSAGEHIVGFPQAQAICIYHRGAYESFPEVNRRLLQYAEENNMTPTGYFRNIYMEGPPTHGANMAAYMTQIALPIKFADPGKD